MKADLGALEAQCRAAAADDPEPWRVLADALIARGDPAGELAALRQGGHAAPIELPGAHALAWRHGFLVGATLHAPDLAGHARALLAHPIARMVDRLCLGPVAGARGWTEALAAVTASAQAAHLRELRLDTTVDPEAGWLEGGDLSAAWARLPALAALEICCADQATLGVLDLPRLERFVRSSAGLRRHELDAIQAARWPALAHLELHLGARRDGSAITAVDLAQIARGASTPRLAHLGLRDCELADDALAILASSALLPRLRSLDLSGGVLTRAGKATLVAHAATFAHLERLVLPAEP